MIDEKTKITTLDNLSPGTRGRVVCIHEQGRVRQRILTMGLVTGVVVEVMRVAPMGDPVEFRVKGYNLSLRKEEACLVEVEVIGGEKSDS